MHQPAGFINTTYPHHVCSLQKSIYGLKQMHRAWYTALRSSLLALGFFNSKSDSSLFIFNKNDVLLYVLVYVDDLILTGNNTTFLQHVVTSLGETFSLKDLTDLHYFLGVEVIPVQQGLFLSQNHYIHDLLIRLNMTGAKTVHTLCLCLRSFCLMMVQPLNTDAPLALLISLTHSSRLGFCSQSSSSVHAQTNSDPLATC